MAALLEQSPLPEGTVCSVSEHHDCATTHSCTRNSGSTLPLTVAPVLLMHDTYFPQASCLCRRCTACIQIHSPKRHGASATQTPLLQRFLHRKHKYHIPFHLAKGTQSQSKLEKKNFSNCSFFLKSNFWVLGILIFFHFFLLYL